MLVLESIDASHTLLLYLLGALLALLMQGAAVGALVRLGIDLGGHLESRPPLLL